MTTANATVTSWAPTGYGQIRLLGFNSEGGFWADIQTAWDGSQWTAEVMETNYRGDPDDLIRLALEVAFN